MSGDEVGKINCFLKSHLNWKIPRFSDLPYHRSSRIWSPKFNTPLVKFVSAPSNWCFLVDKKWIHLSLTSETRDKPPVNCVRIGVVNENGAEINVCDCQWNPYYERFDGINLIKDEQLTLREREIPNGYLRLFCEILSKPGTQVFDAGVQNESENGLEKLSENLRDLLDRKKGTDLMIKVGHREFNVHEIILRARSPVFDDLLSHNLGENKKRVIEIKDCQPEVFEVFLLFIYSGKIESITSENACSLYCAADKFKLPDLKRVCISSLKKNLSFENICQVICLSRQHKETDLFDLAVIYFTKNMSEILNTSYWLLFLKENPFEANELCIQALKLGFTKKIPCLLK